MSRASPLIWLAIVLFFLLPTAAGRFLLDIAGGLMIFVFTLPILLSGLGWVGWKLIKSRLNNCENCGASFMDNEISQCPICGSPYSKIKTSKKESSSNNTNNVPASSATIDIKAEESN